MTQILDGKLVASAHREILKNKVSALKEAGQNINIAILVVGDDSASKYYMNSLVKAATNMGMGAITKELPSIATEADILKVIDELNNDASIYGILPMMPLPKHLDTDKIVNAIKPAKDLDCLTTANIGMVASGKSLWAPATARAVMAILKYYEVELKGKNVVIVGRSNVVGKPLFQLMLNQNATVTVCHSKTLQLGEVCKRADVLVAAVGKAYMITPEMVKEDAIVIDVGINEVAGKMVGDVNYEEVSKTVSAITPVPGGVGSVTTVMILEAALRNSLND